MYKHIYIYTTYIYIYISYPESLHNLGFLEIIGIIMRIGWLLWLPLLYATQSIHEHSTHDAQVEAVAGNRFGFTWLEAVRNHWPWQASSLNAVLVDGVHHRVEGLSSEHAPLNPGLASFIKTL